MIRKEVSNNQNFQVPYLESAIAVEGLTKIYKLYGTALDRLKESINPIGKKYHKDFYALNGVSFDIKKGETVGIIGKNGSGKSTLLKMIAGVLTPTSGNVRVNGSVSALLELGAGFNPELTGLENIYFTGTLMGYAREDISAKLADILAFADIGDFVYQPVKTYSSGMFVRLAFSVAINVDPEILIVDEALSVGDNLFQARCFDRIIQMKKNGTTILFVTHAITTFQTLCDYGILIDNGVIKAIDDPKTISFLYYKLQRDYECNHFSNISHKDDNKETQEVSILSPLEKVSRFGLQTAKITAIKVFNHNGLETLALETGNTFRVQLIIEFYDEVQNPAIGVMFKNLQGLRLMGMHTYHEKRLNLGRKVDGDKLCVTMEAEMLLNPGKYTMSAGVADHVTDFDYENIDTLDNLLEIEVYGKLISYGLINCNTRINIEDTYFII